MNRLVNETATRQGDPAADLVRLYDRSVGDVYGYLVSRCGSAATAEDLTSEVFMAAVDAVRRERVPEMTVAWLISVARNKLVDHWRHQEVVQRQLAVVEDDTVDDEWDVVLDRLLAERTLAVLGAHHRAALTLRYLDGLSVPEVAHVLGRTVHATEALLVRARAAFRRAYGEATS